MKFKVDNTDNQARACTIQTAHSTITTPVFMPVGTQASVKALDHNDMLNLGAKIILGNTYHLYLRPSSKVIKKFGGLHGFSKFPNNFLTDSGGFQAFSLGKLNSKNTSQDENGIIHTPSFSLAWEIKKRSKYGNNMVIPKNPLDVKNYMNKGKIIVGPNFYEGVDFKDDNARWQIITKIPYMELTNPYIKYRLENDKHWYTNETLKRLEQTIGRIVRNENDWGVTYIFDKQFERFINLFPRFIKNAIKGV